MVRVQQGGVYWMRTSLTTSAAALAAMLALLLASAGTAARSFRAATFAGYGFEACNAPSLESLGLPGGSPIYFDMEAYAVKNTACTQAVQTFVSAWVAELHLKGYVAGVYGSASSTMRDLQALAPAGTGPDDVWIADWNGNER